VREAVTDQSQAAGPPFLLSATPVIAAGGNIFTPQTLFIVLTAVNPWGETMASVEKQVVINAPNNAITLVYVGAAGGYGTQRMYVGFATGQQVEWVPFNDFSGTVTILTLNGAIGGAPPSRSSSYLPDSDGDAISAGTLFRWVNRALELASETVGGLFDYSGVSTVTGNPQYIVPGEWSKISTLWYDGYPLAMDDAGNFFRRNTITASILASVATSLLTDRMMLEVWPQPSRTAAQTTLAQALSATANQAVLSSIQGFLLTDGMANINGELVFYNGIQGNTLKNLIRGLSGTTPSAQIVGAPVNELNMFWQGFRRYAPAFKPGDSGLTLPVPVGWNSHLFKYVLGRAKLAEQNVGDFSKLEDDLIKKLSDWQRANKVTTGPRQIGEQSDGIQTLPSFGGGWVLPTILL